MLRIQLKKLGKKKVKTIDFNISTLPKTLQELIEVCVQTEVQTYNDKRQNLLLMPFLSAKEMQNQAEKGKISLGDNENKTLAVTEEAIANAIQGFKDGIFVVFINDDEIKDLQQPITINSDTIITFIRLTFLTGTYW